MFLSKFYLVVYSCDTLEVRLNLPEAFEFLYFLIHRNIDDLANSSILKRYGIVLFRGRILILHFDYDALFRLGKLILQFVIPISLKIQNFPPT